MGDAQWGDQSLLKTASEVGCMYLLRKLQFPVKTAMAVD
ncbi:hypothetical protein XOC_1524 [Xanthomonas oryzae pv. oryzicola BLS256]|uniref:Uncharacterized protein n=1 Tax=Xanthomonas oryzae pv. oryzicola (strain BLS256) TaxID=383407 RepID=G7TJW2_XANOB|nr:hypothetical protein XOC_1524 [Xanthomonas oryzae pv. oryzicola BLS256]QEO98403.1 hypothetical protein XOCgx_3414 [Xanthomonas oryzae pv. oryzicola]